jgi:excinuclease ABC subunit B
MPAVKVYANSHYVTPKMTLQQAVEQIKVELDHRLAQFKAEGKLLEAQRLEQRVNFDMEMMLATGSCAGIENYSRYLTGRKPGEPPPTMFEYLPDNASSSPTKATSPCRKSAVCIRATSTANRTLSEYGFRLPSCMDNRPLKFEEWDRMRPQTIHVSATPGPWELDRTGGVFAEQVIRPTGLIDPPVEVRPVQAHGHSQVDDVHRRSEGSREEGPPLLVTVLTKRMAEDLTEYMHEQGVRVRYMHSDIDTVERIEIIRDLRLGAFDALVGINLLREGSRHSRMRPRRHSRRRQGRLPAQRDLTRANHRPRRAQRRRQGHSLRRQDHRLDGARHGRNRAPPREASRLQSRTRHHAAKHQVHIKDILDSGLRKGQPHHRPARSDVLQTRRRPQSAKACAKMARPSSATTSKATSPISKNR